VISWAAGNNGTCDRLFAIFFIQRWLITNIRASGGYLLWSEDRLNAIRHYNNADFPAIQLVWADRNDKFPWDKDFEEVFIYKQPLDGTLNEVFNLDYGQAAERLSIGGEWTRSEVKEESNDYLFQRSRKEESLGKSLRRDDYRRIQTKIPKCLSLIL